MFCTFSELYLGSTTVP